ncbi:UNVERIFIED_CONTAM: hypothetical protein GTU68_019046 [Idotea baltica]|nr:hypothetical protein [Idotea baltica]
MFGYKLWLLCTPTGYMVHAEPCCGSSINLPNTGLGKSADVILGLVQKGRLRKGHSVFFDNYFTTSGLMNEFSFMGIAGTGTMREGRLGKGVPLPNSRLIEKKGRGHVDYTYRNDLVVMKWKDNKVVCLVSNKYGINPQRDVSRWSKEQKKKVSVPMPNAIAEYNKNMGGVDLSDQFVSNYQIRIRSRKWWWPLFAWSINCSAVNAWILYKTLGHEISLLEFIRCIVQQALLQHGTSKARPGPSGYKFGASAFDAIRQDGKDHWPEPIAAIYSCCRHCGGRASYKCSKCDLPLHPKCIREFHK